MSGPNIFPHGHSLLLQTASDWENKIPNIIVPLHQLDVHESVHRDTIMRVTNKMQLYRLTDYS
jgi:hypothetical protein